MIEGTGLEGWRGTGRDGGMERDGGDVCGRCGRGGCSK